MSYFMTGGPRKEHGSNKPPPSRRIWERSKAYAACPTIFLAGIHLGRAMRAPPGSTLSQNDWPETTQKLIPSPQNLRLSATWQSSPSGFS